MPLSLQELRRRFIRLKQSRVRVSAAQARFKRVFSAHEFDHDRAERAQRKLKQARQELAQAFAAGLELLNPRTERLVRQHADKLAALEHVLGMELAHQVQAFRSATERFEFFLRKTRGTP